MQLEIIDVFELIVERAIMLGRDLSYSIVEDEICPKVHCHQHTYEDAIILCDDTQLPTNETFLDCCLSRRLHVGNDIMNNPYLRLSTLLADGLAKKGKHVYLLRHGQSLGNHAGSIVGWTDSKLSPKGRVQANNLFRGLYQHVDSFTSISSSDLSRCTNTLDFALGFTPRPIINNVSLRELNFGDEEGLHFDSLPPADKARINSFDYQPKNGQTWHQARSRVLAYLSTLPNGHHLVCTHGGVICAMTYDFGLKDIINNCSIVSVEFGPVGILGMDFHWEYPRDAELTPKK